MYSPPPMQFDEAAAVNEETANEEYLDNYFNTYQQSDSQDFNTYQQSHSQNENVS